MGDITGVMCHYGELGVFSSNSFVLVRKSVTLKKNLMFMGPCIIFIVE